MEVNDLIVADGESFATNARELNRVSRESKSVNIWKKGR